MSKILCPYAIDCIHGNENCMHRIPHNKVSNACTEEISGHDRKGIHGSTCLDFNTVMSFDYNKVMMKKRNKFLSKITVKRLMNE